MPEVVEVVEGTDLGFAPLAFEEDVGRLGHPADVSAGEHLEEDLVAHRVEFLVGDGFPADEEVSAHGVGDPADGAGEQQQSERLGAP